MVYGICSYMAPFSTTPKVPDRSCLISAQSFRGVNAAPWRVPCAGGVFTPQGGDFHSTGHGAPLGGAGGPPVSGRTWTRQRLFYKLVGLEHT